MVERGPAVAFLQQAPVLLGRSAQGNHMTPTDEETRLRKGQRFHEVLSQINPASGKAFTMKEAASALGVDYATFRNLEARWRSPCDEQVVGTVEVLQKTSKS